MHASYIDILVLKLNAANSAYLSLPLDPVNSRISFACARPDVARKMPDDLIKCVQYLCAHNPPPLWCDPLMSLVLSDPY